MLTTGAYTEAKFRGSPYGRLHDALSARKTGSP